MFSIDLNAFGGKVSDLGKVVLEHPSNPFHNIQEEHVNWKQGSDNFWTGLSNGDGGQVGQGWNQMVMANKSTAESAVLIAGATATLPIGGALTLAGVAGAAGLQTLFNYTNAEIEQTTGIDPDAIEKLNTDYGKANNNLAAAGEALFEEVVKQDPFGQLVETVNNAIDRLSGQSKVDERKKKLMEKNLAFNKESSEKEIASLIKSSGQEALEKKVVSLTNLDRNKQQYSDSGVSVTSGSLAGRIETNIGVINQNSENARSQALEIAASMRAQTKQTEEETLEQYEIDLMQGKVDDKIEAAKMVMNLGGEATGLISKLFTAGVI